MTDLVAEYVKLTGDVAKLEAAINTCKNRKSVIAQTLFDQNGKGHVYDLGNGEPMIISSSKSGTRFFSPKDKWKNRDPNAPPKAPKVKKAKGETIEAVQEPLEESPVDASVEAAAPIPVAEIPISPEPTPEPSPTTEPLDPLAQALADLA
jgi:hypothetical protein